MITGTYVKPPRAVIPVTNEYRKPGALEEREKFMREPKRIK